MNRSSLRLPGGALQLFLIAAAVWPVFLYLARSYAADSDACLPGLLFAGAVLWALGKSASSGSHGTSRNEPDEPGRAAPSSPFLSTLLLIYAALYGVLPPLGRALFAMLMLGSALLELPNLSSQRHSALVMILLLSTPLVDTLSFVLGGPLRAASAQLATPWLVLGGVPAHAQGALIWIGGQIVSVDAPCSGINGLWSSLVVASILALYRELRPRAALALLASCILIAAPANGWRAVSLIYGGQIFHGPFARFVHPLVGLEIFAVVVASLVWLSGRLAARHGGPDTPSKHFPAASALNQPILRIGCVVLAALAPLASHPGKSVPAQHFPGWPRLWMGEPIRRLPPSPLDRRWNALSVGPLARFRLPDGSELLLRWIDHPGRGVHPPEDCYRGQGYQVDSMDPLLAPVPGSRALSPWRRFRARRGDSENVIVREIIVSRSGKSYSDPSWWWWRVVGPGATDHGPWWFAVIQRRAGNV